MSGDAFANRAPEFYQTKAECYMREALALARNAWGNTNPNPMVGALLVDSDGSIIGRGWHRQAGLPHAEIEALQDWQNNASTTRNLSHATLYVTLEPCSTQGRTPPCTDAIRKAGIGTVVIGTLDPNPLHAGRALGILRQSGIQVQSGILAEECEDLNLIFNHWITRKSPFLAGKIALTLDGRAATRTGHSQWITGSAARLDVHRWRRIFPAIAVGSGTALADDPALTARLPDSPPHCPVRLVFDRRQRLNRQTPLRLLRDSWAENKTFIIGPDASWRQPAELPESSGCIPPANPPSPIPDEIFFARFRENCLSRSIPAVWIEGGPTLFSSMLNSQSLDYLFCYQAPKILGDPNAPSITLTSPPDKMSQALNFINPRSEAFPPDILLRGFLR